MFEFLLLTFVSHEFEIILYRDVSVWVSHAVTACVDILHTVAGDYSMHLNSISCRNLSYLVLGRQVL